VGLFETLGRILETASPSQTNGASNLSVGEYWAVAKPGSDYQQLKAYSSWVYAAATVVAKTLGMVDGHLLTPDDNEIETHPFLDLWAKPCRAWRGTEWREIWVLHRLLAGNSYLEVVTNGLRTPVELWPLAPDRTEIVPSPTDWIKGYRYTGAAGQVELTVEQVIHSKRANPSSNYYGLSVVQAAAQAIDLNQMMKGFGLAAFRNNATPKTLVMLREDIPPDQAETVNTELQNAFKGVANSGRTGVTSSAVKDIKRISMSPEEMDYIAGQDLTKDEIFAMFGVHPANVGMTKDVNRANAEAAEYTLQANVVAPELGALEDMINSEILPRFDSRLRWAFDNAIPEDQDRQLAKAQAVIDKQIGTQNEARDILGMDQVPEGDRYAQSFSVNWAPVGQEAPQLRAVPARLQTAKFTGVARQLGTVIAKHESAIKASMETYFRAQRKRVYGRMRNELASWPDTSALTVADLGNWLIRDIEKARAGVDEETEKQSLYALLLPLLIAAGLSGYEYIKRLSGREAEQSVDALASQRARAAAEIMTATTIRQLLAAIEGAEKKADALAAIEAVFDRALNARAPLVGRVEASRMVNEAARFGAQLAGFEYKQWQTVQDDRVEETCADNESFGAVPIDAAFPSGDYEPPTTDHFGCRCVLVPAMAEDVGVTPVEFPEAARA
jgi:HK97 family phage portal protein